MNIEELKELEELNISIANIFGKQSNLANKLGIIYDQQLRTHSVTASIIDSMRDPNEKERAIEINNALTQKNVSIASAAKEFAKGNITQDQYNNKIIDANTIWEDIISKIKITSPEMEEVVRIVESSSDTTNEFYNSAVKSKMVLQDMDNIMDQFSGIPAMREFNTLIKTNTANIDLLKTAFFALGAAAAKFAWDYFGALKQIQMEAPFEAEIERLNSQVQIREKLIEFAKIDGQFRVDKARELANAEEKIFQARFDATNAARRAALDFNAQISQSALSFKVASKTALFGDKLGSVRYAAAQMEMAGIGADRVAEAVSTAGSILGEMPTSDVASDMAVLAARTGASSESIASISNMFMKLDKTSLDVSLNMQEGMRAMAESMNIPLDSFMNDVAEASKDALSYQIKSGSALAKQVAYAKSIGVNFNSVAKAGQSMVLNYKDSIKSEMQLSALLGRQIDLSEVRAKFAAGDTKGAMQAIKTQGLDPSKMDMFQQQALSQALGGLDLQEIKYIFEGKGKEVPELTGRQVGETNKQYLQRVQAAKKEEAIGSANISAQQAVFSAQLEKQITEEYFNKILNPQSAEDKKFRDERMAIEKSKVSAEIAAINQNTDVAIAKILDPVTQELKAKINNVNKELELFKLAVDGLVMALGGFILQFIGPKIMGAFKGIPNLFKNIFGTRTTIQPAPTPPIPPLRPPLPSGPIPDSQLPDGIRRNRAGRLIDTQNRSRYISENAVRQRISTLPPQPPPPPAPPAPPTRGTSLFGKLKWLVDPKVLTKGAKIGGSALSGVMGGVSGFMEAQEKGLGTGEAVGAGLLQGGLAASGAALGAVFGGPLGMMVGGFLFDALGGWINDNAPGLAASFGKVWDNVMNKFVSLKETFKPIIEGIDNFAKKLGFDEGIGSVFSMITEFVGATFVSAFNGLIGIFGLLFDVVSAFGKLLKGDFSGAWQTISNGFKDFINNILSPFEGIWFQLKKSFASFYNMIADSFLGRSFGMKKMDMPAEPESVKEAQQNKRYNTYKDISERELNILKATKGNFGKYTSLAQYQSGQNVSDEEIGLVNKKAKELSKLSLSSRELNILKAVEEKQYFGKSSLTDFKKQHKITDEEIQKTLEKRNLIKEIQSIVTTQPTTPQPTTVPNKSVASVGAVNPTTKTKENKAQVVTNKVEIIAEPTNSKLTKPISNNISSSEINSISLPIEDLKRVSQLQTTELKTINGQLLKTFVRTQTSADNLLHLNNVTMANLIQQNNNMLKFQEATVEVLETIAKNTGGGKIPTIKLDGKILTDQIYTVNQSNRITRTEKR